MTGKRSKQLRANIIRILRAKKDFGEVQPNLIYDALNRVQDSISTETETLEGVYEFETDDEVELYDLPDDFYHERMVSSAGKMLEFINMDKVEELKRNSEESSGESKIYYYKWNNQIGLLTELGGMVDSGVTITMYYWRLPDETFEKISDSCDPALDRRWDTTLLWGALADLTNENVYYQKFNRELLVNRKQSRAQESEVLQIPPSRDYD